MEVESVAVDQEIDVLKKCTSLLDSLDESSRARVLGFLQARFGGAAINKPKLDAILPPQQGSGYRALEGQLPGIALRGPGGDIKITVRDLKARSANDAAVRLVHVMLLAHSELTGERWVSAKKIVVPLLKLWRVYDGNTRSAIAGEKGIVRDGDKVSLDVHAEQRAREFIEEILDETTTGIWAPNGNKRSGRVNVRPR